MVEPARLSRDQIRTMETVEQSGEPVGISAVTILEVSALFASGRPRVKGNMMELFDQLRSNPMYTILPVTIEIAIEAALLGGVLRDPSDRAIVATARVHRLRLLTSDQRIVESGLVPVVD